MLSLCLEHMDRALLDERSSIDRTIIEWLHLTHPRPLALKAIGTHYRRAGPRWRVFDAHDDRVASTAQASCALYDGSQHLPEIRRSAGYHAQDLRRDCLLLQGMAQLPVALLQFL